MAERLRITELDFDQIKLNLKNFLRQQEQFSDYDFEGSGLSVLIDLLAYNTHYNAYYLNMVANESFLDTALLRDSIVSHAKTLGYTPRSFTAPVAFLNISVESFDTTPARLTIPRGYVFLSQIIDNTSYNFITLDDVSVTKTGTTFEFENVAIYEGQLVDLTFVYSRQDNPKRIFSLPNENIDTKTLKVSIRPTESSTESEVFEIVSDVVEIDGDSPVYFLQEGTEGTYQIYFGDGNLGKELPDGAYVTVSYLITNGDAANGADGFVGTQLINGFSEFVVSTVSPASGGDVRENSENIRRSAISQFSSQNRLVTFKDYESYILSNYPNVEALSVWGGEEEIPPVYGKVYISLKPRENFFLSDIEKQRIIDSIITPKSIVSVGVEIRDPEFLFLQLQNFVTYDKRKTNQTAEQLKTLINASIQTYKETKLNSFGSTFVISDISESIKLVSPNSIIGSRSVLRLQKRFLPQLNISRAYSIDFSSEISRGTDSSRLISSQFDVFDSVGTIRRVQIEEIPQSFSGVTEIQVIDPGSGYTTRPTVTITGDGTGATAEAVIVNGRVISINVINRGINYTRSIVTISGGNGFGASAIVVLDARFGDLRTVFFDSLSRRQVVNPKVGTINYDTGKIEINDLRVISVPSTDGLIRMSAESTSSVIQSTRNTIITLDENDPQSLVTEMIEL
jgi:hypothetical protein